MRISDWSSDVCSSDLLHLLDALGGLGYREVPVTVVDGLELAPVDGHDGPREQVELATQHDKLRAGRADSRAVVATEVGDRLTVGHQPAGQPHQLNVELGLPLKDRQGPRMNSSH